jgi:flagellar motor protein MotB
MFEEEEFADENVGWPSYVDFLSTFVFVLIVFIGSILYLLSGDIHQRLMEQRILPVVTGLTTSGIANYREGNKIILPLKSKVDFDTNRVDIRPEHHRYLRQIGRFFADPAVQRIVILGFADSQPCRNDPFCNWDLSARRAQEVLKFFYLCSDCGFNRDEIRRKLTLTGEGNVGSSKAGPEDRRVDIVLDFNEIPN